jgi:hypothetical protein
MVSRKKSKNSKRNLKRILDGGDITIIIKDFEGKRYELSIDTDNTIESIISECKKKSHIDEKEFKYVLQLEGELLDEFANISDYKIGNESTLNLIKKKLLWSFKRISYQYYNRDIVTDTIFNNWSNKLKEGKYKFGRGEDNLNKENYINAIKKRFNECKERNNLHLFNLPQINEAFCDELNNEMNDGWEIVNINYPYEGHFPSEFPIILFKKIS